MNRADVGARRCPLSAYCYVLFQGRLANVNQPKSHVVNKVSHLVIAVYIRVNIMARRLEGAMEEDVAGPRMFISLT
jgi:hypothetical protein